MRLAWYHMLLRRTDIHTREACKKMNTFITLFRGINVGGNNILLMKDLVNMLEALGCTHIKTYIQSGNALYQTDKSKAEIGKAIGLAIEESHGFKPNILVLDKGELSTAIKNNPFPTDNGKVLHFFFLRDLPKSPDFKTLQALKAESESFELINKVFYLHAPDGIGRSKLVPKVEKNMGTPTTARNWNTVSKVNALLADIG